MRVFESVKPRCLCVSVSVSMILFMSNGGCCGGFVFRENIIDNVLPALKATNHELLFQFLNYLKLVDIY